MADDKTDYIGALRKGDHVVLRKIYQEFAPDITRLVRQNGGSVDDARDVLQTGLMVIFEKVRQHGFELTGSFGGYLYAVCRNVWGNKLQKKSRGEVRLTDDLKYQADTGSEPEIEKQERSKLLWDKLHRLGSDCRKLLMLHFQGKSMETIRDALKMSSVSYASKRKFICKERLTAMVRSDPRYKELLNA
ncbi:MAG: sigma-70 family RNA polymerase sigma factor [Saprospiraceae bacterium]|nr:sigma-70 family RNA polymerase sigma factor [Saprospiraceae bacterium]